MNYFRRRKGRYLYQSKEVRKYAAAAVLFLFLYLVEQIVAIRLGYYLNGLNKELGQLQVDNNNYRQEYSGLVSLPRLNDFARQKKMTVPDIKDIIYLDTN
jgi:hypothetical protein